MEKCFWCSCELTGEPKYIKDFGYVCDKDYKELGYKDIPPEFEAVFRKHYRKLFARF